MNSPELLAAAGNWQALRAAVANGADAVYSGVEVFNARMRAATIQQGGAARTDALVASARGGGISHS